MTTVSVVLRPRSRRLMLAVFLALVCAGLLAAAMSAAPARRFAVPSLSSGGGMDPNGYSPRAQGSMTDPDGLAGWLAVGSQMDPNGGVRLLAAGIRIDPNGASAQLASGSMVDPDGHAGLLAAGPLIDPEGDA